MVDPFPIVAFAQFFPYKPPHHDLNPLLPDDGILSLLESHVVVIVDPIEGWWDLWLLRQELGRLWGRHVAG